MQTVFAGPTNDRFATGSGSGPDARVPRLLLNETETLLQEVAMGKYVVGWLLGVPAVALLMLWFFFR